MATEQIKRSGYYVGCGEQINPADLADYENSGLYVAEAKHDGIWGSCICLGNNLSFYSCNDHQKNLLMPMLPEGTILLGELGYGTELSVERKKNLGHDFMDVFDIAMINGQWITHKDMEKRRAILVDFIGGLSQVQRSHYLLTDRVDKNFIEFYLKQDEGIVLKKKGPDTKLNLNTVTGHWIKVKKAIHVDAVIMNYQISSSKAFKGLVSSIQCGVFKGGRLTQVTSIGSLNIELRADILTNWPNYAGKVIEIECYKIFKSGSLRHASIIRLRDDKNKEACTWEGLMKVRAAIQHRER